MRKLIGLILLAALICIPCSAEESSILKMVSPKLKQFLADHPAALSALTGAISESLSNRTVNLFYFYSDDESIPRASHHYPAEASVGIVLRENQEACDEYIGLIFEIWNSQGEKRFKDLAEQAKSGVVSKADFVKGIQRQEFQAVQKVRALIAGLKLTDKERDTSYFVKKFVECPDNFEEFLTYKPRGVTRDQSKEYERLYDSIRRAP